MSDDTNRYQTAYHEVTIEANLIEPALVAGAFDVLRQQAHFAGLEDVDGIRIRLSVEFGGRTTQAKVDELRDRLEALWLADITKDEVRPPKSAPEEDKAA